jgi:two-component sensor histidine kinase
MFCTLGACQGLLAWALLLPAVGRAQAGPPLRGPFFRLLAAGDSVYAEKKGYRSFARAQQYYDRAQLLAERSQDTLLLAEAVFAKARVYDAWNKEPRKTVQYFQQAAQLFAHCPAAWRRYFYARYLVAHAYDKVPDSLRTVRELRALRRELLARPDSVRQQVPSTVEMALTATEVHNYPLADSLLRQLVHRARVHNDPETYNYLDHYFLAQARLDVRYRHLARPVYLDSLRWGYGRVGNPFDRTYYGYNLADLYAEARQYGLAYHYLRLSKRLSDSLDGDASQLRQTLFQSEEQAAYRQRQYEAGRQRARTWGLWGLGAGLTIISLLSFYLYRQQHLSRRRAQALALANAALAESNAQLDQQVAQVELLNKEIQHRVKNNLHMVYSLLQLQERRTDNEEVQAHLQAARLRVESIAALHNQLLLDPDEGPDLAVYLKGLISSVVSCLANDRQVVTHLQTAPLHLPPSAYLALSLILNEWVTNSIKYAETSERLLEISVQVRPEGHHTCLLYADNGSSPAVGTAEAGLGTQIIYLLTRQLGATLTTAPGQPYHYTLCLPTLLHAATPAPTHSTS